MNKNKEDIEFLRLGLVLKLISKNEIIAWAEKMVSESDCHSDSLFELLNFPSEKALIDLFNELEIKGDYHKIMTNAFNRILVLIRELLLKKTITPRETAKILYELSQKAQYVPEEHEYFCLTIDDEFALAEQNIVNIKKTENELIEYLNKLTNKNLLHGI